MITRLWQRTISRFKRRSYSQTILEMKPVAYYQLGNNPLLHRPSNPALDIIVRKGIRRDIETNELDNEESEK